MSIELASLEKELERAKYRLSVLESLPVGLPVKAFKDRQHETFRGFWAGVEYEEMFVGRCLNGDFVPVNVDPVTRIEILRTWVPNFVSPPMHGGIFVTVEAFNNVSGKLYDFSRESNEVEWHTRNKSERIKRWKIKHVNAEGVQCVNVRI